MTNKILTILMVGLSGFIFTASAGAAKAPHRYSPKHGMKCAKSYKRVMKHKRHHQKKVFCVKRAVRKHKKAAPNTATIAQIAAAPEQSKLRSHLDPTFTRNPLDPFEVTYAYSASATQEAAPEARALGIMEEPAPLPSGVLSLFSDGKLECAINVGGSADEGQCPVNYQALGAHTVTTIYTSGEQSATETEVEQIDPIPTTTTLDASYSDSPSGPELVKQNRQCTYGWGSTPGHPGEEEWCVYRYEWVLGTVTAEGGSSPAIPATLRCADNAPWCATGFGGKPINGAISTPVTLRAKAEAIAKSLPAEPSCEWVKAHATQGIASTEEWSYPGSLFLIASQSRVGYLASSAEARISFSPTLPC